MTLLLAAIPYTTYPEIGPLKTFGLMTAIGVVLGIWYGAAYGERFGLHRDDAYRIGTRMVMAGVVGARLTWVLTHLDQIESPIDLIAVWDGGLQFSGGFIAAIAVGLPTFLKWNRIQRWQLLDGFAVAVLVGAAFGRLGCLSVGEHFGKRSDFFLATRYDGGPLREQELGIDSGVIVQKGMSFLNPALYESITLFLLFGALWWLLEKRKPSPGTVAGTFLIGYAVQRFTWDSLRVNDERVAGMTGAQWMCLAMVPIAIYILLKARPAVAARLAAGEVGGVPVTEMSTQTTASGAAVSTTKRRSGGRPAHATKTAERTDEMSDDASDEAPDEADPAGPPGEAPHSGSQS